MFVLLLLVQMLDHSGLAENSINSINSIILQILLRSSALFDYLVKAFPLVFYIRFVWFFTPSLPFRISYYCFRDRSIWDKQRGCLLIYDNVAAHFCRPFPFLIKINMGKTWQKVTKDKDPNRLDAGRKGRENVMEMMKENILNDAEKGGRDITSSRNETCSSTNNSSNETTSVTSTDTIMKHVKQIKLMLLVGFCHIVMSMIYFLWRWYMNLSKGLFG